MMSHRIIGCGAILVECVCPSFDVSLMVSLVICHCSPTFLCLAHSSVHGFTKDIICSKLGSIAAPSGLCQASSDPLSMSGPCATLCNTPLHRVPCGDNYMYTHCLLHQSSLFSKSKAMFYSSLCPYCLQECPWLGDFGLAGH